MLQRFERDPCLFPLLPICWIWWPNFSLFPRPIRGFGLLCAADPWASPSEASTLSSDTACFTVDTIFSGKLSKAVRLQVRAWASYTGPLVSSTRFFLLNREGAWDDGIQWPRVRGHDLVLLFCTTLLLSALAPGWALGKWRYLWGSISWDSTPILPTAVLPMTLNTISVLVACRLPPQTRPLPRAWEQIASCLLDACFWKF